MAIILGFAGKYPSANTSSRRDILRIRRLGPIFPNILFPRILDISRP
jgi:hypothetical protein